MTLADRLAKIRVHRAELQARIKRKAARREAVSYDYAKLVRETTRQIKAEMRLEKERVA